MFRSLGLWFWGDLLLTPCGGHSTGTRRRIEGAQT